MPCYLAMHSNVVKHGTQIQKQLLPAKNMSDLVVYYYNVWKTRGTPRARAWWHAVEEVRWRQAYCLASAGFERDFHLLLCHEGVNPLHILTRSGCRYACTVMKVLRPVPQFSRWNTIFSSQQMRSTQHKRRTALMPPSPFGVQARKQEEEEEAAWESMRAEADKKRVESHHAATQNRQLRDMLGWQRLLARNPRDPVIKCASVF